MKYYLVIYIHKGTLDTRYDGLIVWISLPKPLGLSIDLHIHCYTPYSNHDFNPSHNTLTRELDALDYDRDPFITVLTQFKIV